MTGSARSARLALAMSIACALTTMTGCASMQQKIADAGGAVRDHGGALLGAAAGATAGALICDDDNRVKCAIAGGAVGASLGYLWDKRQARLRQIAQQQDIPITTAKVKTFNANEQNGLAVAVNDGNMFATGSYQLTADAARRLRALAGAYRDKPQSLLVLGHTDSTGPDSFNLTLSEKRARTVASLLADQGIDRSRVFYQGVGESQPIADNDTVAGRAANRRVEIVETDSDRSIAAYSLERQSDPSYLAHSNKTSHEKAETAKTRQSSHDSHSTASEPARQKSSTGIAQQSSTPNHNSESTTSPGATVDFGGQPATSNIADIIAAAGTNQRSQGFGFSLISSARAAQDDTISPCYMNRPRSAAAVRNLASGQALDPSGVSESDYWPGLNGNVWTANVNGQLVALKNLRVMADSGTIAGRPEMLVYQNYHSGQETPDYRSIVHMRSYKGPNGLILRSYFTQDAPMQCMDVVMSNNSEKYAKTGVLYYDGRSQLYQNDIQLHRLGAGG